MGKDKRAHGAHIHKYLSYGYMAYYDSEVWVCERCGDMQTEAP
jgi:hypothetical protein